MNVRDGSFTSSGCLTAASRISDRVGALDDRCEALDVLGGEVFELEQTVIVPSELSAITCGGLDAGEMFQATSAGTLPRGRGPRRGIRAPTGRVGRTWRCNWSGPVLCWY